MQSENALEFLSEPIKDNQTIERKISTYDSLPELSEPLVIKKYSFTQQYGSIYHVRLSKLHADVLKLAQEKWSKKSGKPKYVDKILDIQPGVLTYVLGTLYLEMSGKPDIMSEIDDEDLLTKPDTPLKYTGDDDIVSLEDATGRVELSGEMLKKEFLVTGMVVGILGREVSSGVFEVSDICYPGMAIQEPIPHLSEKEQKTDKFVALISGLSIGSDNELDIRSQLLSEFLSGELGTKDNILSSSFISRVIIAGNSITKPIQKKEKNKRKYGYDSTSYNPSPISQLDEILTDLCSSVDVDLMPGTNDFATFQFPQQPMLPVMFRNAHKLSTFHTVTNPYWSKIDDVTFLGTSGQNIDDIYKYVNSTDRLKLAEMTMYWRHIAPSAPDTLWCYPFNNEDPFVIEKTPHVYFIGNQPEFEEQLVEGPNGQKVKIILVPSFKETGNIVLVNLNTLRCNVVHVSDHGLGCIDPMDES